MADNAQQVVVIQLLNILLRLLIWPRSNFVPLSILVTNLTVEITVLQLNLTLLSSGKQYKLFKDLEHDTDGEDV